MLYHSVHAGQGVPYFGVESFDSQMEALNQDFNVIAFDEFMWYRSRSSKPPLGSVLITFDDGFMDNYTNVRPIMTKYSLPWVLFTTTAALEDRGPLWFSALRGSILFGPWSELEVAGHRFDTSTSEARLRSAIVASRAMRYPNQQEVRRQVLEAWDVASAHAPDSFIQFTQMLGEDELRELSSDPLVAVGAHTHTHPFLTALAKEEMEYEIGTSLELLRDVTGVPPLCFAYPSGDYGSREVRALYSMGVKWAFAVNPRIGKGPNMEIGRTGIYHPDLLLFRAKAWGLADVGRMVGRDVG